MGGTTLAKDVVTRAIKAGKHVVTANKALIAADLPELWLFSGCGVADAEYRAAPELLKTSVSFS